MIKLAIRRSRCRTFQFRSTSALSHPRALAFLCLLVTFSCFRSDAQFKTELVNDEGATAPCAGIGPIGGPAARKCTELFERAGFLKADDVGVSGLIIGTAGKDDGVVTHVEPGSPASQAGLMVGDVILAVGGKPVMPTPATVAARLLFGKKGEELRLTIRREGSEKEVSLVRIAAPAPPDTPKSPSFFISLKPLIDWRGKFVPCLGMGPAAMAAIAYCDSHFKPFGFIKVGDRGATSIVLDEERAVIATIEPSSPASIVDLRPGDEIVKAEGKPLVGSAGEAATRRLFGKAADKLQITVHSGDADKTVILTLAAKPK